MSYRMWLLAVAFMAGSLSGHGALAASKADGKPIGLGDFFRVKRADDPRIAPDASRVAFVEVTPDVARDSWRSAIRLIQLPSGSMTTIGGAETDNIAPRWNREGTALGFISFGATGASLNLAEIPTGNVPAAPAVRKVANLDAGPIDIAIAPNGRSVAILARLAKPLRGALISPPDGASWSKPPKIYSSPAFQTVAEMLPEAESDFALFVVDATGGEPRRLTKPGALGSALPYTKPTLEWTPDGKNLLIALNLGDDGYLNMLQSMLYTVDAVKGSVTRLAGQQGGAAFDAAIAGTGALGFACRDPARQNLIRFQLCYADSMTAPVRIVAPDIESMIYPSRLAPDGKGFFGVYGQRGVGRLTWFGIDGQQEFLSETGGGDANSYLHGGALTVANDGTVAYLFSDAKTPSEVALVKRGEKPRLITALNADYIAARQVNPVSELTFMPTDGSHDVGAFVMRPAKNGPAKKPPGIVLLHGGQSSDYGPDFDLVPQVFAAHGYMVIMPNYRGSGSYGRGFANASTNSPMDLDYDVTGAADALVAQGADPERLYVMGGSGGGMITGWTIGRTNRFRAAVMWYPVVEWWHYGMESATGPTSLGSGKPAPWENPAEYIARSPYALIGKVSTPTMLIVGDKDRITPVSGTIAYFRGLRVRGIDAELLVYPGEAHGIEGTPSHLMGHITETLGWLARHGGPEVVKPDLPQAK